MSLTPAADVALMLAFTRVGNVVWIDLDHGCCCADSQGVRSGVGRVLVVVAK